MAPCTVMSACRRQSQGWHPVSVCFDLQRLVTVLCCLFFINRAWELQSTQTGYADNSHPPTTGQALKSTKINLKEKEALQGRDLVRQSIFTSYRMSPNSSVISSHTTGRALSKQSSTEGSWRLLKMIKSALLTLWVFWTSTDLPMKLTLTELLLLLNKIWRLWTWRQDGRAFYVETNDCSKILYAVKKAMLLVSEKNPKTCCEIMRLNLE